jgi:hypothetical protein
MGRPTISEISSLVFVSACASNVSTRRPPRSTDAQCHDFFQPVRDAQDRKRPRIGAAERSDPFFVSDRAAVGSSIMTTRHLQDERAGI